MADATVQIPPDSTGKYIDNSSLTIGALTVHRQRGNIASPTVAAALADVVAAGPDAGTYGLITRQAPRGLTEIIVDTASSGDIALISGTAAQIIRIWKLYLRTNGNTTITFLDSTPANLMGAMVSSEGGEILLPMDSDPWMTCTVAKGFTINNSAAVQISGRVLYTKG